MLEVIVIAIPLLAFGMLIHLFWPRHAALPPNVAWRRAWYQSRGYRPGFTADVRCKVIVPYQGEGAFRVSTKLLSIFSPGLAVRVSSSGGLYPRQPADLAKEIERYAAVAFEQLSQPAPPYWITLSVKKGKLSLEWLSSGGPNLWSRKATREAGFARELDGGQAAATLLAYQLAELEKGAVPLDLPDLPEFDKFSPPPVGALGSVLYLAVGVPAVLLLLYGVLDVLNAGTRADNYNARLAAEYAATTEDQLQFHDYYVTVKRARDDSIGLSLFKLNGGSEVLQGTCLESVCGPVLDFETGKDMRVGGRWSPNREDYVVFSLAEKLPSGDYAEVLSLGEVTQGYQALLARRKARMDEAREAALLHRERRDQWMDAVRDKLLKNP